MANYTPGSKSYGKLVYQNVASGLTLTIWMDIVIASIRSYLLIPWLPVGGQLRLIPINHRNICNANDSQSKQAVGDQKEDRSTHNFTTSLRTCIICLSQSITSILKVYHKPISKHIMWNTFLTRSVNAYTYAIILWRNLRVYAAILVVAKIYIASCVNLS